MAVARSYGSVVLVGLSCAISAFAIVRLLLSQRRLSKLLLNRREIKDGPLYKQLRELCSKADYSKPVRLSVSSKISIPLAVGILSPEICLPERALTGLSCAEQRSMLAHELAHLMRRDPAWLVYFRLL